MVSVSVVTPELVDPDHEKYCHRLIVDYLFQPVQDAIGIVPGYASIDNIFSIESFAPFATTLGDTIAQKDDLILTDRSFLEFFDPIEIEGPLPFQLVFDIGVWVRVEVSSIITASYKNDNCNDNQSYG